MYMEVIEMLRRCLLVLLTMLMLCGLAQAEDVYLKQLLTPDTCEHNWKPIVLSAWTSEEGVHGYAYEAQFPKTYVAVGSWHVEISYIMNRCALCGLEQYMPSAQQEFPHNYRVTGETASGDAVTLVYTCEVCGHVRRETLSLAELQMTDPASEEVDCMHGGACQQAGLFTTAQFGYYTEVDDRPRYLNRVQMEENGQLVWKVAQRLHCPFCCRPQMLHMRTLDESWEEYELLPEMTYAEFMNVQTEDDWPYIVLDRLRNGTLHTNGN